MSVRESQESVSEQMPEDQKDYGAADAGADPAVEESEKYSVGRYIYQDNGYQGQRRDEGFQRRQQYGRQRTQMLKAVEEVHPEFQRC